MKYIKKTSILFLILGLVVGSAIGYVAKPKNIQIARIESMSNLATKETQKTETPSNEILQPNSSLAWTKLEPTATSCTKVQASCVKKSMKSAELNSGVRADAILASTKQMDVVVSFPSEVDGPSPTANIHVPDLAYSISAGGAPEFSAEITSNLPDFNPTNITGYAFVKLSIMTGEFTQNEYTYRCSRSEKTCTELSYKLIEGGY